jgi:hypothetical protein
MRTIRIGAFTTMLAISVVISSSVIGAAALMVSYLQLVNIHVITTIITPVYQHNAVGNEIYWSVDW